MSRVNSSNAFETTLTSSVTGTDLTFNVVSTDGTPDAPFYLGIRVDDNVNREYVKVVSKTATSVTIDSLSDRHLDGSAAASGQDHPEGASVKMVVPSQLFNDLWDDIEALEDEIEALDSDVTVADIDSETATAGQVMAADGEGGASWEDQAEGLSEAQGDTRYIKRDGSNAATDNLDVGSNRITNMADPDGDQDAATKKYVDDATPEFDSPLASDTDDLSDIAYHSAGPDLPRQGETWHTLVNLTGSGYLIGGRVQVAGINELPSHAHITIDGGDATALPSQLSTVSVGSFETIFPPVRFETSLLIEVHADREGTGSMNAGWAQAWTKLD